MKKTLYLSVDESLYKFAKKLANANNRSLSSQIEFILSELKRSTK